MSHVVIVVCWQRMVYLALEVLEMLRLLSATSIFVGIVGYIATLLITVFETLLTRATDRPFLVQVLNIKAAASLMRSEACRWPGLQRLILSSGSALRV